MTQRDVTISGVDQLLNVDVIISSPSASALASLQELTTLVVSAVEQAKVSAELAQQAANEAQDTATTIEQQAEAVQQAYTTIIEVNASIAAAEKIIAEQAEAVAKAEAAVKEQAELVTKTGQEVQQQAAAVAAAEQLIKQCTQYVKDRAADIVIAQQQINDVYNQVAQAEIDSDQSAKTSCDCADRSEQAAHQSATSAYAAQLAEQNSQSHQNSAENSEVLAKRSADYAQQAEQAIRLLIADVDDKVVIALDSAKKAEQWAENPINQPVEPDRYSAKHWARKAEQFTGSMTNALIFRGPWDASTGTTPPILTPKTPDFYKITQAGIIESVSYSIGDSIVLDVNTDKWFKIDGTDHPITSDLDVNSELTVASARAVMLLNQNKLERTETAIAADKLAEPFTLTLTGDSTGEVSLDGAQAAELAVTVVDDSHTHSTATVTGLAEALADKLDKTETAIAADKLAEPFTLTLTGDSTGEVSLDGAQAAELAVTVVDDSHTHSTATVTGLAEALADKLDKTETAIAADKLAEPFTLTLTGDSTGKVSLDGAQAAELAVTVVDDSHTHSTATVTGLAEALADKLERTDNAVSASQWQTERTISLAGDATGEVAIDGQSDVILPVEVLDDSHNHTQDNIAGLSERFESLESHLQQISNPNLLINGDFSVWQRGSFPDRYKIGAGSSASQSTRVANTSPASGAYALKIERLSDDTFYSVIQKIENGVQVCGGQTVSMSMWMKSNKTGTMSFALRDDDAETNIVISDFTYHTANEWQKIEVTADCPKSTGSTLIFYVLQPMYNVCTDVGDWIEATGVKLEISAVATPFIPDDPATNLAKCQRYYIKIDFGGTRMDQDGYQGTWSLLNIDFPTTMRTTPTIILHGNSLAESNSAFLSPGGITLRANRPSAGGGVTGYEANSEL